MKCNYLKLLNRYVDSELSPADKILIEEHLSGCSVCAQELKIINTLKQAIPRNRIASNTEFFWQELKSRIAKKDRDMAEVVFDFGKWAKRLVPVPVIAALAAIAVLNYLPIKSNPVDEYLFSNHNSSILELIEKPGNQSAADIRLY